MQEVRLLAKAFEAQETLRIRRKPVTSKREQTDEAAADALRRLLDMYPSRTNQQRCDDLVSSLQAYGFQLCAPDEVPMPKAYTEAMAQASKITITEADNGRVHTWGVRQWDDMVAAYQSARSASEETGR